MKELYCIEHEHMTLVQNTGLGIGILHEYAAYSEYTVSGWEPEWCFFDKGWATCEPPVNFEEDWDLFIDIPTDEEIELMDSFVV